jgi:polysaccharide biosynthesis/export protein
MNKTIIFLLLFLFVSGCGTTVVHQSGPTANIEEVKVKTLSPAQIKKELEKLQVITHKPYRISTGDRFDYYVYEHPDLTIKGLLVTPGGNISVGLAGVVNVGGLTVDESLKKINKKLSRYLINPKSALIPTHIKSSLFTIIGSVAKTGVYEIKSGYKITDAVAVAKGLATGYQDENTVELADLEHAYIVRDNKILPVSFISAIRKGSFLHNIPLQDGDYIYIPSSIDRQIFVLGEVMKPGNVSYSENQTLTQALAYSKGKKLATSSDIAIIIRGNMVTPKVYKVNVEDILQGRAPDFRLYPSDIVYVPKSTFTEYNLIIEKLMPTFVLLNLMTGPASNATLSIPVSPTGN